MRDWEFRAGEQSLIGDRSKTLLAVCALAVLGSTAHAETPAPAPSATKASASAPAGPTAAVEDPWEKFNRGTYKFNNGLDHVLIRPLVQTYIHITPKFFRKGVSGIVDNLLSPTTAINDLLQGHPKLAVQATTRFVVNSTLGVAGVFDVAGATGLPGHHADFGQTLGRYGVTTGPYIYLPLFGPTTLRDGLGIGVDAFSDPVQLAVGGRVGDFALLRFGVAGLDARTSADEQLQSLNEDAADPYATIRSVYSQNRAYMVRQAAGQPEVLPDFDETPAAP